MRDIDDRVERWKKRLLDLNKRNRLINFRETKRSNVEITFPTYDNLYKKLVQDEEKLSFSFPPKTTYDEDSEEYNVEVQEGDLQTNKTLNEQQRTLKVLRGRAKTSMEEQGINSLYLTFGMLRWKESDISEVVISAPLVLAPVTLTVESITDPYVLQLHEDEIVVNPSLAFKLENDFGIILPEFDGHEDDISEYLSQIATIAKKNNWQVILNVHLTLLSFLKINMYKDLDNNKDRIVSNPTIKALCGDTSEIVQVPSELNNFDHDKNVRPIDTYQVVDADSSQQDAILLSKRGISFVLQGPPGTGKSQTITNIIAEAIADGKKVLFVSEKMAALEVVKRRLTEAGLDDFCLTLHSYKANKKEILNQLAKTLAVQRISLRQDAIYKLSVLEEKRRKLNEYQEQLHTKCMPLNISIYEANGRLAKLSATQDIIFGINDVENTDMNLINGYRYLLNEFSKTIGKLSSDYTENPWYGCNVPAVTHELRHDINVNLKSLFLKLGSLSQILEEIIDNTGVELTPTINNITTLLNVLNVSSNSPIVPVRWLAEDVGLLRSVAQEYFTLFHERETKIFHLLNRYTEDVLGLAAKDILLRLESHVTEIKGHLNKEHFPTSKDIVIKAQSIITECAELRTFIQSIDSQSKELSTLLGSEPSSINLVFRFEPLIRLILENPQPADKWFKEGESIKEFIVVAKTKQSLIRNNLTKVTSQFRESILAVDYDSLISRFTNTYNQVLAIIRNFNSIADNTNLKLHTIISFVDEQSEKLKDSYSKVLDAYDTSRNLVNSLGIERVTTLEALISLEELQSRILQNPKPTLAWFDDNKDMAIDKLIVDIKNTQKELSDATALLLSKYNKDILDIDYKNMLIRFNTDYRRFKFFKGSYRADKKIVLGFSKELSKKLTDNQIVALLNQISLIKEKEQWLTDNKFLATDLLGTSYLGIYTDWGNIERNRATFKIIKDHFDKNKIPEKLKQLLSLEQISLLSVSERIPSFVSSIFGSEVVFQSLETLLNKIKTTIKMSTDIKDDIDYLCSLSIRISSMDETSLDNMISILSCVKEVNQNRGWFKTNNDELLECFAAHYKNENTDWDDVAKRFDITEKIISFFAKEQIPENLVNYLISSVDVSEDFGLYSGYIEDIRRRHITERLNDLLSEQDIKNIEFSVLFELLQVVHDHAHISLNEYVRFSHYSKEQFSFEDTISDIVVLDRIQEIENTTKRNYDQLQASFEFMFEEINTDWEKIISALNCVDNLKERICCDENISIWAARYGRELSKRQAEVKPELEWFVNLLLLFTAP